MHSVCLFCSIFHKMTLLIQINLHHVNYIFCLEILSNHALLSYTMGYKILLTLCLLQITNIFVKAKHGHYLEENQSWGDFSAGTVLDTQA